MSLTKLVNILLSFAQKYLNGRFRPTNLGLIRCCVIAMTAIALSIGGIGAFKTSYMSQSEKFDFEYVSNDPSTVTEILVLIPILFLTICVYILYRDQRKLERKRTCLAIEHLSFPNCSPGLMRQAIPKELLHYNQQNLHVHTEKNDPNDHFQLIKTELEHADRRVKQGEAENWFPIYGAIAHVPMVAYAGHQWGSRRPVTVMDFKRETKKWHNNDGLDDGEKLQFTNLPTPGQKNQEICLCVELSIKLDDFAMDKDFAGIPRYYVKYPNEVLGIDLLSSTEKQERYTVAIGDYLNNLIKRHDHISKIHLFVTAQSSFVFRLGKLIHQPHFPDVLIHQYDRDGSETKHPWSVRLNFGGDSCVEFY